MLLFGSETKVVKLTGDNQFDASTDRTLHVFAKVVDRHVKRDMDCDGHVDLLLLDTTGRIVVLHGDASGLSDETTVLAADEPIRAFAAIQTRMQRLLH